MKDYYFYILKKQKLIFIRIFNFIFIKFLIIGFLNFTSIYYIEIIVANENNFDNNKTKFLNYSYDFYYRKYLCSLLVLNNNNNDNNNCMKEIFSKYNFFYDIKSLKTNINLIIDFKKSFIENLFLIISIIPFLKNNSTIQYSINNKDSYKLFKLFFKYKKKKNRKIIIKINDINNIKSNFSYLINYKWESPMNKNILDIIRYIISNYYDNTCLQIYEKFLNKNFEYYIQKNNRTFSKIDLTKLLSK